jgi:hypothetical protein
MAAPFIAPSDSKSAPALATTAQPPPGYQSPQPTIYVQQHPSVMPYQPPMVQPQVTGPIQQTYPPGMAQPMMVQSTSPTQPTMQLNPPIMHQNLAMHQNVAMMQNPTMMQNPAMVQNPTIVQQPQYIQAPTTYAQVGDQYRAESLSCPSIILHSTQIFMVDNSVRTMCAWAASADYHFWSCGNCYGDCAFYSCPLVVFSSYNSPRRSVSR